MTEPSELTEAEAAVMLARQSLARLHPLACLNLAVEAAIAALAKQQRLRESLSDHEIDAIAESMEGGLDGFLKTWGWRQYARAIENAVHGIKEPA